VRESGVRRRLIRGNLDLDRQRPAAMPRAPMESMVPRAHDRMATRNRSIMTSMDASLGQLVGLQYELQSESFGIDPLRLTDEERIEFIRWNVLALTDELHELLQEVGWKPWATSRHVNEPEATGELVD